MAKFFLSHQSLDAEIIKIFAQLLETTEHQCWYAPRDIPAGRPYQSAVVDAIKDCDAMIVFVSSNTEKSEYVPMEVERATHYRKPLFPVRIENTGIPHSLELFLSTKQWMDIQDTNSKENIQQVINSILSTNKFGQEKVAVHAEETKGNYVYEYPRPCVTVDILLFGLGPGNRVSILLIKRAVEPYKDFWALPGGFVQLNETLEVAAHRELEEETGVASISLEQFAIYDECERDPRDRVISVSFFGITNPMLHNLEASTDAANASWQDITKLPKLAFDHVLQLERAFNILKSRLETAEKLLENFPDDSALHNINTVSLAIKDALEVNS